MNFVGHAVVAGRERAGGAYAFGAMVPDLRRFARGEPLAVVDDEVDGGIASHHRVDAAFHDHALFRGWMRELVAAMPVADRGARAAAHVAVELAIDGVLLRTDAAAYDDALGWAGAVLDGPWGEVVARMRAGAVVEAYATATGVADRVVAVMERRPRLRPIAPRRDDLAVAVATVLPSIEPAVSGLVTELVSS